MLSVINCCFVGIPLKFHVADSENSLSTAIDCYNLIVSRTVKQRLASVTGHSDAHGEDQVLNSKWNTNRQLVKPKASNVIFAPPDINDADIAFSPAK
jgi:hypothetical protein